MRRKGFTLVELLVVIGVIALLISILMPALNRAREQANWIKCMSNLRQLGQAFTMYTNNNKGFYPRPGVATHPQDWIFWEDMPPGTNTARALDNSAIAPYLGKPMNPEVLRCPSDDVNVRRSGVNYRFSYSSNYLICRLPAPQWAGIYPGEGNATLRVTQVVNSSQKILLIDETHQTVDDGCWAWMETLGSGQNVISVRHMKKQEQITLLNVPHAGRGNALFVDGHAEFIERKRSYDRAFYDPKWNGAPTFP
jgi:prepilin-type N-terminal cleavage/methylation domain-containing protein/prepilin-type processing-associated H-X9-DG protein